MSITIFSIIFYIIITNYYLILSQANDSMINETVNEYIFEVVDVATMYKEHGSNNLVQLEAYKRSVNDDIIKRQNRSEYGSLNWVSLGNPRFLKTPDLRNKSVTSLFHFTPEGFYVYVEMLTKSQVVTLVKAIKTKYKIDVLTDQIFNLILSKFQCQLNLFGNSEKIILVGKVTEFRNFPLRMNFWAPVDSIERIAFERRLAEYDLEEHIDLNFECEIASHGRELKMDTLTITSSQMSQLDLIEKLFGPLNTAFITRDQLHSLTNELYASLNIAQEYQLTINQFDDDFTHDFISQTTSVAFTKVDFNDVFEKLSNYSKDPNHKLQPSELKKALEMLFVIKTIDTPTTEYTTENPVGNFTVDNSTDYYNTSQTDESTEYSTTTTASSTTARSYCIQFNTEYYETLKNNGKLNDKGLFLNIIKLGSSINSAIEKLSIDCFYLNRSLNEQLGDLNSDLQNDIRWKINNDSLTITPDTIHVARLNKFLFSKALVFNRVRKEFYAAPFQRKLSLYTQKYTDTQKALTASSLGPKFPIGTIVAVSSRSVLFWFDENGKGFGDYLGWFVADGRNETPDLTRKFLVGADIKKEDFDQVGKTGGLNYVNLNVDKLPIYQINIEGLQSVNDLEMNKAKISYSGDTQVYENRPIYHIVTFIIYLDI